MSPRPIDPDYRERLRQRAASIGRPLPEVVKTKVVGLTFVDGYPTNLRDLWHKTRTGFVRGQLVRDPHNPQDPDAIEVRDDTGRLLGHLPRAIAHRMVSEIDDRGIVWTCRILDVLVSPDNPGQPGVAVECRRQY